LDGDGRNRLLFPDHWLRNLAFAPIAAQILVAVAGEAGADLETAGLAPKGGAEEDSVVIAEADLGTAGLAQKGGAEEDSVVIAEAGEALVVDEVEVEVVEGEDMAAIDEVVIDGEEGDIVAVDETEDRPTRGTSDERTNERTNEPTKLWDIGVLVH